MSSTVTRDCASRFLQEGLRWLHDGEDFAQLAQALQVQAVQRCQHDHIADKDAIADALYGRTASAFFSIPDPIFPGAPCQTPPIEPLPLSA